MDLLKILFLIALSFCCESKVLSQSDGNDTQCICSPNSIRGDRGPEGPKGEKGDTGRSGRRGQKGDMGFTGIKGDAGETGPAGEKGSKGEKGSCDHQETHVPIRTSRHVHLCEPGTPGRPGENGRRGAPGRKGEKGHDGDMGLRGLPGNNGAIGNPGENGVKGFKGLPGDPGENGNKGLNGAIGPKGDPGPRGQLGARGQPLSEDDFDMLVQVLQKNVSTELGRIRASLRCGIYSSKWRRVVHIDRTDPTTDEKCPKSLTPTRELNPANNRTACGKPQHMFGETFNTSGNYTHVCGRVRGYQSGNTFGYQGIDIKTCYADGVLITSGDYTTHLWTYAVGISERKYSNDSHACSTFTRSDHNDVTFYFPSFVKNDSFCEHKQADYGGNVQWNDTLWDDTECITPDNMACQNQGWFHREVEQTNHNIEIRLCAVYGDIFIDILEIWVQ